ncbi:hypothetical protein BJY01DRAFT_211993 [Aspergillus pseudoustus]|uniref:Zn(2)-C6 fungal-type domain-containing protein n=1 Tax=Aspergillus pseudoustus TaxID=1810923 RepID=A0ABR4K8E6_9EURO
MNKHPGIDRRGRVVEQPRTARSKNGCRTCRIRKVKCDEERLRIAGQHEPQCRRCSAARILCEWQGGPIPRKKCSKKGPKTVSQEGAESQRLTVLTQSAGTVSPSPTAPTPSRSISSPGNTLQAANSLSLSAFDRLCLDYLQSSALVIVLGKHWPWSTIHYAYHRIAVKEPMLMSAILASTGSEIRQSRLYNQDQLPGSPPYPDSSDIDARLHYGRALSGLRETLQQEVQTPEQIEAIFITLWLLIDYENRFGNGAAAINIHIRGIQGLLFDHVVPALKSPERSLLPAVQHRSDTLAFLSSSRGQADIPRTKNHTNECDAYDGQLRRTAVPLFLLWTLYFYTPGALLNAAQSSSIDDSLFRSFLVAEKHDGDLRLEDLYRISRQSPSRFWGDTYPATAKLDDLENLPGLTLYHRSHVLQFKITELVKRGHSGLVDEDSYSHILAEIVGILEEYDIVLSSAKSAPSCDIAGPGRRVLETMYWASITFYGTLVYFHLCTKQLMQRSGLPKSPPISRLIQVETAVSHVLELSLRLYRSRPRLMLRIPWQLFIAGIATSDNIYQDWVSIRLRELGRYGRNFTRLSDRYDEIIRGGDAFASARCLGMLGDG